MPPITALLHTTNAGLRLGRALETLLPCAEILIVDQHSADSTLRVARSYGARMVLCDAHARPAANYYLEHARHDWILCLDPSESITEGLQATLFEWSSRPADTIAGKSSFSVFVRDQTSEEWRISSKPETRLVPRSWTQWSGFLPADDRSSIPLEGELLRLAYP
jgi:glycosyltransferase involved in cell wall biosynthesis